jgi:hypothetical protein
VYKYTQIVEASGINFETTYESEEELPVYGKLPKGEKYDLRAEEINGKMMAVPYVTRPIMTDLGFAVEASVAFHEAHKYKQL